MKVAGLRERRAQLEHELSRRGEAATLSLSRYRLSAFVRDAAERYVQGQCLDVGSGQSPYQSTLESCSDRVLTVDVEDRTGQLDLIADIQDMPALRNSSFDSVVCTQVLEHVPQPWLAMNELARVLKPGGHLVMSVPHLSAIHESPTDYFRYTRYGVAALCENVGLEPVEFEITGGWVAFLVHGLSVAFLSAFGTLPGLYRAAWTLNYVFLIRAAGIIDRFIGFPSFYPCDVVAVARKPIGGTTDQDGNGGVG